MSRVLFTFVATFVALTTASAQDNPYKVAPGWAQLPANITLGGVISVEPDTKGNIWVVHRNQPPILEFDASGKLLKSFGTDMFVQPHGLALDRDGNVWVTDSQGKDGKGHQVFKFSPDGKVLMTLGKAGVAAETNDSFAGPSDVVVSPNGEVFVTDGHVANANGRVVKFSKDGKFIKAWGTTHGSGPGEMNQPHSVAMDSRGRVFVADRANSRIDIFDQDGKFLDMWKQFGRPSGVFIDKNDVIYVADSESESVSKNHDGWKRGIRVGSAKTGEVTAFIPDPVEKTTGTSAAEGVAADAMGNIYGAEVGPKRLMRYVKN
jgi:sugar lactone lactonase YvrE